MEIHPEPSEEERAAIAVAIERLLAEDVTRSRTSQWWQAGLRESLEEDDEI